MLDNTKGVGETDTPAADPSEGLKLPYGTDTTWETDNRVYASCEWHDRHNNWRDLVDLGTCDTMTAYAAGRFDGHQHAMSEFYEMWKLLGPFYEFVGRKAARE
jgi:hypothetical protein